MSAEMPALRRLREKRAARPPTPEVLAWRELPLPVRAALSLTRSRLGRAAMKPLLNKYVSSFVRQGVTKLAGVLTGIGIVTLNNQQAAESLSTGLTEIVIGLAMWGMAQLWSWLDKAKNQPK